MISITISILPIRTLTPALDHRIITHTKITVKRVMMVMPMSRSFRCPGGRAAIDPRVRVVGPTEEETRLSPLPPLPPLPPLKPPLLLPLPQMLRMPQDGHRPKQRWRKKKRVEASSSKHHHPSLPWMLPLEGAVEGTAAAVAGKETAEAAVGAGGDTATEATHKTRLLRNSKG